jgi:CMP-N-acetylneuraminic acid synthetase
MAEDRKFAVESAGFWFRAARMAQDEGRMADAVLAMEQAFNHTENALVAARRQLANTVAD